MKLNAKVVVVKCKCQKLYGMRVEQRGNDWAVTWAFPVNEKIINGEGYSIDDSKITGRIILDDNYNGCPYCKTKSVIHCTSCDRVSCSYGTDTVECYWCHMKGKIVHSEKITLNGGAY
jgi:hypothetical protein